MKKPKAASTTILIGTIPVSVGNEIRVELGPLGTATVVNIRRWYTDKTGTLMPTRRGITITIDQLEDLTSLVRKTLKHARQEGLLPKKKGA